ncbi:ABC transporter permease [Nocardioides sp. AE5]|uniref:ABC transporter permease n=1 Tax=Nocardioides sp. AE5 TaxID=2962573 RepID=UPI002882B16E|nr:ABC transporter permease [Nocardioides sp. AE5]MDT0201967.1 ABC transporter permease [Nocardioides sp. AE5]
MNAVRTMLARLGWSLVAPVLALVIAGIITSLILAVTGNNVSGFWDTILTVPSERQLANILNYAGILYLAGIACAIGFRMNLFNIGVEGQYRVGSFAAAVVAGEAWLPGRWNIAFAILVAMLAGAVWAGIAGILRVTRGVSEVISTIMLNAIAGLLVGFLIAKVGVSTGNSTNTKRIPGESTSEGTSLFGLFSGPSIYTLLFLSVLSGLVFWWVLNRTTFGFNLRATGTSETAAVASGVSVKKMVVVSMLMSGAVAGLVGMPVLFGQAHNYGSSFEAGLGFAGIAVALLGRNHPIGVAFGALIFAFLQERAAVLNILAGVSPDIVAVSQGIIVLAVVIAYEVVRRYRIKREQAAVGRALARTDTVEVAP